jgi:hypothetical protein
MFAMREDRQIGRQEVIADALYESEATLGAALA